jgi:type I restriction enzyme S subunit
MKLEEKQLPRGWEVKKFEDLLDYIQPAKYIVDSTEYSDEYKTPVLTAGKSFVIGYTNEKQGIFNQLPVIIFDDFTTANKFVRFPFKVKSSAMKILKPKDSSVNIEFVFYYMQTVRITFDTHKRYWISTYSKLPIPIPPIDEQQKIVTKIEELFSQLENGKQQLLTAQKQLKTYRQSLLKSAFEGKLTNPNLKAGELPKSWKLIKVSEISNVVRGGSPRPAGDIRYYDGAIPFLKVRDVTKDNGVYLTTFEYTIKEAGLHKTRQIKPNTLLLSNSGATLGVPKICMINATLNDGIAAFLELDQRSNLFLYYFWLSKTRELRNINMGAAQPNLNTDIIKNYLVPYCSIEEQQRIVDILESKLTICDKIEETIKTSLQQSETLRQSILKKAFEGRLV